MLDRRIGRACALLAVSTAALFGAFAAPAGAAEITLTSLADQNGVVEDDVCTLREAVIEANTDSPLASHDCHFVGQLGKDTINLPDGTLTMANGGSNDDAAESGDFDIALNNANSLTINGGPNGTTIDAHGVDRMFEQQKAGPSALGDRSLTLRNLNLVNGHSGGGGGAISFALDYQDTASLTLDHVNMTNNVTDGGGGGALYAKGVVVSINDAHVDNNVLNSFDSTGVGGGIAVVGGTAPSGFHALRTTIDNNSNESSGTGFTYRRAGGLYLGKNFTETEPSTFVDGDISGNTLHLLEAGVGRGVGVVAIDQGLLIKNSTISNNVITGDPAGEHGFAGFFLEDQSQVADNHFLLQNVTVSGNNAVPNANTHYTWAGGGLISGGIAKVVNSTFTGNVSLKTQSDVDGTQLYLEGGSTPNAGSYNQTGDSLSIRGSLVDGPDGACQLFSPSSYTHSNDVETRDDTCGFSGGTGDTPGPNGDRENVDPATIKLGALEDNGGPGPTHELLPGSVLIDAIPTTDCLDSDGNPLATDGRGAPRPGGTACDVGAYEVATCGGVEINRVGTSGNDMITGTAGADSIYAGDGDDTIDALGGDDRVCAGDGNDTLSFASATAGVTADLGAGTATGDGNDAFTGVENLIGSPFGDTLTGDGADNLITGGAGTDSISALGGEDSIFVRDTLADTVACGDDADVVEGDAAGVDSIASDCETLKLTPSGGGGGTPPPNPEQPKPQPKPGVGPKAKKCPKAKKKKAKKAAKKCKKRKKGAKKKK